ncbi:/ / hypothetical protein / 452975:454411 Reverse [Candidatus Hepatoplasma crinochetorum]|uniref:ABC-2 family transporter protein n=1 Tax=Candidatus Hepatoplasma crinochetorum TaxID=295596 RepID=A0A0G7ZMW9_9MOLU|nr:/ / hypothetical protein / 452975:454411 Reverse [Candidatus Hepatoplasma crinochetorum]
MYYYTKILFKQYFKSPYTYAALFFPFILILGLGKLIPAAIIIPSAITVGITITILFLFGGSIQEVRRTSLIKSMSLTRLSKSVIFSINIIVATTFSILTTILIMSFSYGIYEAGYLVVDFSNFLNTYPNPLVLLNFDINWDQIYWFTFIYAVILTVCLSYSITFVIISFTKTTNALYIISILYFLLILILGGIILPVVLGMFLNSPVQDVYKFIPHYYTNQLMSSALASNNSYLAKFLESDFVQTLTKYLNVPLIKDDIAKLGDYALTLNGDFSQITNQDISNLGFESDLFIILSAHGQFENLNIEPLVITVIDLEFGDAIATAASAAISSATLSGEFDNSLLMFILNPDLNTFQINQIEADIILIPGFGSLIPEGELNGEIIISIFDLNYQIIGDQGAREISIIITGLGEISADTSENISLYIRLVLENLDGLKRVFEATEPWNWGNLDSMLNSFLPLVLIIFFGWIGIHYFKWSIR